MADMLPEITVGNVIKEVPGSGSISWTKAGVRASRKYYLPWQESDTNLMWWQRIKLFIGDPSQNPPIQPDTWSPDFPYLVCLEADVEMAAEEPTGIDSAGKAVYRRVIMTANYAPRDCEEGVSAACDVVTVPGSQFSWSNVDASKAAFPPAFPKAPQPLTEDIGKLIPKGEYKFTRHQLLAPDFYSLQELLGKVNRDDILGFPALTLLFSSFDGQRDYLPDGTRTWTITFNFLTHVRPGGHLALWRPDKGGIYDYPQTQATKPGTSQHSFIFEIADFTLLFTGF